MAGVLRLPTPAGPLVRWRGGVPGGAVIEGTIIDDADRSVAGLEVTLWPVDPSDRSLGRLLPQYTSTDGVFRFEGLAEGCYAVTFRPPDRYRLTLGNTVGGERAMREDVCVDTGEQRDGIDRVLVGPGRAEPFDAHFLHINDHHSRLSPETVTMVLDDGVQEIEVGGFARVAAVIEDRRDALGDGVATVHAGDAVSGGPLHDVFGGASDAALMNHVCFDLFALGRHELGGGDLRARFLDFLADHPCRTEILSPVPAADGGPALPSVTTRRFGDRVVGIVAVGDGDPALPVPDRADTERVDAVRQRIAGLVERGITSIVLVSNLGLDADLDLVSRLAHVDGVIGGGSQTLLGDFDTLGLDPAGPYPIEGVNGSGDRVCVVQAWQHAAVVGELTIGFDGVGGVVGCSGTAHLLVGSDVRSVSAVAPSPEADAALAPYTEAVGGLDREVVAEATEDLCQERVPDQGHSSRCLRSQSADHGGALQQLVADAALARVPGVDVSLVGAGIVLDDLATGPVTIADVRRVLADDTALVVVDLTGADLVAAVTEAARTSTGPSTITAAGATYPYAAGLRWRVVVEQTTGSAERAGDDGARLRIEDVEIRDPSTGNWSRPDGRTRYRLVTESGTLGGGIGEPVIAVGGDTGLSAEQLLIEYLSDDLDGRVGVPRSPSTRSFEPAPADG